MGEIKSEDSLDEEERPLRRMIPWIAGGLAVVFLYFISFGPVVFFAIKLRSDLPRSAGNVLEAVYYPHAILMYHSEGYFDYFQWWQGMAKPSLGSLSHADFRDHFERQ